jgi:hypothetical protein
LLLKTIVSAENKSDEAGGFVTLLLSEHEAKKKTVKNKGKEIRNALIVLEFIYWM